MLVIRGAHNLRPAHQGCVATIGNFDGMHRGHQAVFSALSERAEQYGLPALAIVFEPQPMEFFRPDQAPARLTCLREKLALMRQYGVDRVLILRFNQAFANQSATDFVNPLLTHQLGIRHLYVGDDFRFGYQRAGDFGLLKKLGTEQGYQVESHATINDGGERISSTRIRAALAAGELDTAARLLGRAYTLYGRVNHGHQRGRTIGFPTLNLPMQRLASPLKGVFVVEVAGLPEGVLRGVANVGTRPTLKGDDQFLLEVHLFDFAREVYGAPITVTFLQRLRDEQSFDSFAALRTQIEQDAAQAKAYFSMHS